jgi:hypothetical protein
MTRADRAFSNDAEALGALARAELNALPHEPRMARAAAAAAAARRGQAQVPAAVAVPARHEQARVAVEEPQSEAAAVPVEASALAWDDAARTYGSPSAAGNSCS